MGRRSLMALVMLSAVTLLVSCTGGSQHASVHSTSSGPTRTTVSPSAAASCSLTDTQLTYRKNLVILAGTNYSLPPSSSVTFHGPLPQVTTVRSSATGVGNHAGITGKLDAHWHTTVAAFGTTSDALSRGTSTTVHNSGRSNRSYLVFSYVPRYSGTFTTRCGGRPAHGIYSTFGTLATVISGCTGTVRDPLERQARRQFCG